MTEVAFIGLGTMGRGMARNLVRAGHAVTAWNRTRRALPAELDAVTQVDTIAAAIGGKPVVFICLTGPDAQRAVFDEALLGCLGPDVLVIELDDDRSPPVGAACGGCRGAREPISGRSGVRQQGGGLGGAARLRLRRRGGRLPGGRARAAQARRDSALHRFERRRRDDEAHRKPAGGGATDVARRGSGVGAPRRLERPGGGRRIRRDGLQLRLDPGREPGDVA